MNYIKFLGSSINGKIYKKREKQGDESERKGETGERSKEVGEKSVIVDMKRKSEERRDEKGGKR